MFVDARKLPPNHSVEVDICIVGAGAAGITLARDLSGSKLKVAVFESGDFEFEAETQKLYAGHTIGRQYLPLDRDRLRYFGGTTNHWAGSCRPFDAMDLEGWPFGLKELSPYYRRAQDVCQLGPYGFDFREWKNSEAYPLLLDKHSPLKNGLFIYSPPTRFGSVYRKDLELAQNVSVYLNANLVNIDTDATATVVAGLDIACLHGIKFRARARHYVLATGGIENVRLLLNSNRVQKTGLGNGFDLVGRYYMDHADVPGAATILADASSPEMKFYDQHLVRGHIVEGYFCANDDLRRKERLPAHSIGIRAAAPLDAEIELPPMLRNMMSDDAAYYLSRSLHRLAEPVRWLNSRMWRRSGAFGAFITFYSCGHDPNPQSRITLVDSVDALGLRQTQLDWRLPDDFEQKMRRSHELLAIELGRAGVGRLRIESSATGTDPMEYLFNGHHHMGATRMHKDPHSGVVDAECRVHGISNLFIAGSSVFPTYACDDPTMTIVALALRLSDHLKSLGG